MKQIIKTITIKQHHLNWLNNHKEINLSGLVQKAIDQQMN